MLFFFMPNIRKHSHEVSHKDILLSWDARIERFSQRDKCWLRCPVVSTESEEKVAEIMISFHDRVMPPLLRRFAVGRNWFDCSIAETVQKHAKGEEVIIVWVVCGDSTGFYFPLEHTVIHYPKPSEAPIKQLVFQNFMAHRPLVKKSWSHDNTGSGARGRGRGRGRGRTGRGRTAAADQAVDAPGAAVVSRWFQSFLVSLQENSIYTLYYTVFIYCKLPLKLEKHNQSIALFILVLYRESYDLRL